MKKSLRIALALTVLGVIAGFSLTTTRADHHNKAPGPRVFEMRTYHTNPGKLKALHARFRDHTNYLFVKHGMSLVGYWTPKDTDDTLVYILAYPSMEAREKSWEAFKNDPDWQAAYKASKEKGSLIRKGGVESVFMSPTDYSPMR